METSKLAIFDIAANLTSTRFQGVYNGKKRHASDLQKVISRAFDGSVTHMIVSATHLHDLKEVLEIANLKSSFYCTYGVHPCNANEYIKRKMTLEDYFSQIEKAIQEAPPGKLVAIGECGLDYDRLSYTPKEIQHKYLNNL